LHQLISVTQAQARGFLLLWSEGNSA